MHTCTLLNYYCYYCSYHHCYYCYLQLPLCAGGVDFSGLDDLERGYGIPCAWRDSNPHPAALSRVGEGQTVTTQHTSHPHRPTIPPNHSAQPHLIYDEPVCPLFEPVCPSFEPVCPFF